jgi:hypothetical protein
MFKQYRMDGLTEREKAERRRRLQLKKPFSIDAPLTSDKPKEREFLCPTKITTTISRRKRRGFNGCKMSHANKLLVLARADARDAFLRSLRGEV